LFKLTHRSYYRIFIFSITILISIISLVIPFNLSRTSSREYSIGTVSDQYIQAPYSLAYSSQVLTDQARQKSRENTIPVYLPADTSIGQRQIEKASELIALINALRNETNLNDRQKIDEIYRSGIKPIPVTFIKQLLLLSENDFIIISEELIRLLTLIYKDPIRDIDVEKAKASIYEIINPSLSLSYINLVYGITTPFISSNSIYSEEKTAEQKEINASEIDPIIKSFLQGETLVTRGQIITSEIYESMEIFGLVDEQSTSIEEIISSVALCIAIFGSIWIFLLYKRSKTFDQLRNITAILILFIVFLVVARFVIPGRTIVPYVFPVPAFALTIASLINPELGILFAGGLGLLTTFGFENSEFLLVYYVLTSIIGVLTLGRGSKISSYFLSGLFISIFSVIVIIAFYLPQPHSDLIGLLTLCGASIFYGFASAGLTLIIQYGASRFLGIPTALQLIEISRPDHPLLQYLLRNSPGTYQHSLLVANLAEQVAEHIGADPILTRVGALYHDAGKSLNPFYFIENQIPGRKNPHDSLDPQTSSKIIIKHVNDGISLAKKYHLPNRIQDFILEHHGTTITRYQYGNALEENKKKRTNVNPDEFRYPGPSPRSKETAILMLADGCEAKARAHPPKSQEEIRNLVVNVVDYFRSSGQFDNTNLTMSDFSKIIESLTSTLINTYHPRLDYPDIVIETRTSKD
jgi:putative nucleotidyltransferase with HDIG domain